MGLWFLVLGTVTLYDAKYIQSDITN